MTFPAITQLAGNSGGNTTSYVIALPDALAAGDLLIVAVCKDGTGGVTWPGSPAWTNMTAPSSDSHAIAVRWHRVDGSEGWGGTGNSITVTGASEGWSHVVNRITGAHATSAPFNPTATVDSAGSTAPDPPAANPGTWDVEDTLWLAVYGWDGNVSHSAYPSGFTTAQITDRWANSNGCGIAVSARNDRVASVDPAAGGLSGAEEWCAVTIAVRPAVPDPAAAEGTLDVVLPALVAQLAGQVDVDGTLLVTLPALAAQLAGEVVLPVEGGLDVMLPAIAADLAGRVDVDSTLDAALPALDVDLAGELVAQAALAVTLPGLGVDLAGEVEGAGVGGALDVALPALAVDLAGAVEQPVLGVLDVTLPALQAALAGQIGDVDLVTLLGEVAQGIRDDLRGAGLRAVLNITDINPPCVWVQLRRLEHNVLALGVYTSEWNLYLVAPDTGDVIRTLNTLGELQSTLLPLYQSSQPVEAVELALPGGGDPKPALRFVVRLHVTP